MGDSQYSFSLTTFRFIILPSLSLSRLHYRFFLCFFLLASACELEKEAIFCVPFVSIGTEKDFFNFEKKNSLGFRWAWIVDLLLESVRDWPYIRDVNLAPWVKLLHDLQIKADWLLVGDWYFVCWIFVMDAAVLQGNWCRLSMH
jgi:hypothetical protein